VRAQHPLGGQPQCQHPRSVLHRRSRLGLEGGAAAGLLEPGSAPQRRPQRLGAVTSSALRRRRPSAATLTTPARVSCSTRSAYRRPRWRGTARCSRAQCLPAGPDGVQRVALTNIEPGHNPESVFPSSPGSWPGPNCWWASSLPGPVSQPGWVDGEPEAPPTHRSTPATTPPSPANRRTPPPVVATEGVRAHDTSPASLGGSSGAAALTARGHTRYRTSLRGNSLRAMAGAVRWGQTRRAGQHDQPRHHLQRPRQGRAERPPRCRLPVHARVVPLGRGGTPDEVATVAALLMSPDGVVITRSDFLRDALFQHLLLISVTDPRDRLLVPGRLATEEAQRVPESWGHGRLSVQ
jgi:hypothetical protein